MTISQNVNVTSSQLATEAIEPIARTGRQRVNFQIMSFLAINKFENIALSSIDFALAELKASSTVDRDSYPIIKLNLIQQWENFWGILISDASKGNEIFKDLIDYLNSTDDIAKIESKPYFPLVSESQGAKLKILSDEKKQLKGMLSLDSGVRFIPSASWKTVAGVTRSLQMKFAKYKKDKSLLDTSNPIDNLVEKLTDDQLADAVMIFKHWTIIGKKRQDGESLTDLLEMTMLAANNEELSSIIRCEKLSQALMTRSYPILPATTDYGIHAGVEEIKKTILKYDSKVNSFELVPTRVKRGQSETIVDTKLNLSIILTNLVLALVSQHGPSIRTITLPNLYSFIGGISRAASYEIASELIKIPEMKTIEFFKMIAKGSKTVVEAIKLKRMYQDSLEEDRTRLPTMLTLVREINFNGLMTKAYEQMVEKRGTYNSVVYSREEFGDLTVRNNVDSILKSGAISLSATEGAFSVIENVPTTMPQEFTEAIIKRSDYNNRAACGSVLKSEFTEFLDSGFSMIDHDETSFNYDFDINNAILTVESLSKTTTSLILPLRSPNPGIVNVSDVLKDIEKCITTYKLEDGWLTRTRRDVRSTYSASLFNTPVDVEYDVIVCSNGSGVLIGKTIPTVEQKSLMGSADEIRSLALGLIGAALELQRPKLVNKLGVKYDYENTKYIKRVDMVDETFAPWIPHPGVISFATHPVTYAKASDLIDFESLESLKHYEYTMHKGFKQWLKGVANAKVAHLRRSLGNSDVILLVKKYLTGQATKQELSRIKSEILCHTLFSNLLDTILTTTNQDSQLARLAVLSFLLESLDDITVTAARTTISIDTVITGSSLI